MNILVDTSVWSLALRRNSSADHPEVIRLKHALQGDTIFSTGLILQELLQGFNGPKAKKKIIEIFARLPLITPERKDHIEAADLKIKLRQKGVQTGTIDVLLAQLCIRHGLSLLSKDKDFVHIGRHTPLALIDL